MMRVPMWATAFVLVAGGSLAAPSLDVPMRAPRVEQPAPSEDWSMEALVQPVEAETAAEPVQIAGRKGRGGGGKRGGSRSKNRGGFKSGNNRHANRNVNRNVNIDRDVDVHGGGDWDDDDDHAAGAALLGGVVGLGVGSMIANDPNN